MVVVSDYRNFYVETRLGVRSHMTARSYPSETSAPWYTLCTGVVEGYQGSGMPTYSYPAAARSRGWFTDPDNQEFGEFCIWAVRDTSSYLVNSYRSRETPAPASQAVVPNGNGDRHSICWGVQTPSTYQGRRHDRNRRRLD
jgi:hypothetical protein